MVAIVNYGAGNVRSLANALSHLGFSWEITNNLSTISRASHIIIPGVGSYASRMNELTKLGLVQYLSQTDTPMLGICLGMQLLSDSGDEGGFTYGLGRIKGHVSKLPEPHVGWDTWEGQDYYFVHHYQNDVQPYAIKQGNLWACQFHPEKSQEAGLQFLKEFCSL